MNIFKSAKAFAWGLIFFPLGLVLLYLAFTYIPGAARFMEDTAWGVVGQVPIFATASAILQEWMACGKFTVEVFSNGFMALLFGTLGDALVISCCIFFIKSIFTTFNRKGVGRFTKREWILTLVGVVAGVCVCAMKEKLAAAGDAILTLLICLGCYVVGLSLMFRGTLFPKGVYRNRKAGFILKMILGIVGDLLDTVCAVFIITALVHGPMMAQNGAQVWFAILWLVISVIVLVLKNNLMGLLAPDEV